MVIYFKSIRVNDALAPVHEKAKRSAMDAICILHTPSQNRSCIFQRLQQALIGSKLNSAEFRLSNIVHELEHETKNVCCFREFDYFRSR